jgi:hypothetical protein
MHILVEGLVCGVSLFACLQYLGIVSPIIKPTEQPLPADFKKL